MQHPPLWRRLIALAGREIRHFLAFNPSDRRWQLPLAAALSSGTPLLVGALFQHMALATLASLGGMAFLYTPNSALPQRMAAVMASALGMIACFTLGLLGASHPLLLIPFLTAMTILVTLVCRFYRVGPPGSLFFVMATAIAAYMPFDLALVPFRVGLLALGCVLATGIAFVYSVYMLRAQGRATVAPPPAAPPGMADIAPDAVLIGLTVGLSLLTAHALALDRPYWVPVSCLAVIQGASLRMVWTKQAHRIAGTCLGVGLAWVLLSRPMNAWQVCATMMGLSFIIELLVVRHYGLATVFITPVTIFLADVGAGMGSDVTALMAARLLDTIIGCAWGLAGGWVIHRQWGRAWLLRLLGLQPPPGTA